MWAIMIKGNLMNVAMIKYDNNEIKYITENKFITNLQYVYS